MAPAAEISLPDANHSSLWHIQQAAAAIKRSRLQSKAQFEKRFRHRIQKVPLKPGTLVLIRNSRRDAGLSDKSSQRYFGPYQIHRQTQGGSYVLQELDGTFLRKGYAAFRLLPYRPRLQGSLHQIQSDSSNSDLESQSGSSSSDSSESSDEWEP